MKVEGDIEYIEDLPTDERLKYLLHSVEVQQQATMALLKFMSDLFKPKNPKKVNKRHQAVLHIANHFAIVQNKLTEDTLKEYNANRSRIIT